MIPKKLWLYWSKGAPLSYLRLLTIKTFKYHNPDWEVYIVTTPQGSHNHVWTTGEQWKPYVGKDYIEDARKLVNGVVELNTDNLGFNNHMNEIYKSDIVRNYVLVTHGGIWSDFDIIYTKPIPETLLEKDFVHYYTGYWAIGFMGANVGSPFYAGILNRQKKGVDTREYQTYGVLVYPPEGPSDNEYNIPPTLVYYFNHTRIHDIFGTVKDRLPEEAIGIHWYAGSPIARDFENNVTPENYKDFDNIISVMLKETYKEV